MQHLKIFDVYPKTLEDFRIKTTGGAIVSILSIVTILLLTLGEFVSYLSSDISPHLYVDQTLREKMTINFDVMFPHIPCSYISLDSMDVTEQHQHDATSSVFKQRYKNGAPLEAVGQLDINRPKPVVSLRPADYCGSCFGAESAKFKCCNSCDDVREAYREKGWAFSNAAHVEQCKDEGFIESLEEVKDEGCHAYGSISVNKIAGNFHFAPGKSFSAGGGHSHVHDLQPFPHGVSWNFAHSIRHLSIGKPFAGVKYPLDGADKTALTDRGMHQYYLKIVPTTYENLAGQRLDTFQFSSTELFRSMEGESAQHGGLPGVFFMYDLSPLRVH